MKNKIVLITGSNKGLGFETSYQLAKAGCYILMGSRNDDRGKASAATLQRQKLNAEYINIDMQNPLTFKKAFDYISKNFGKIDILINNAGVMIGETFTENSTLKVTMKSLRETFEVNFFSLIELTRILLPLLERSDEGKIINLSSILASLSLHSDPSSPIYESKSFAYNASKAALNLFGLHLSHALQKTRIKVFSIHPGWVKTDLGGNDAPMNAELGSKTVVNIALDKVSFKSGSFVHMDKKLPW